MHWRVKPAFPNLLFVAVPEEATRVAKLMAGEADFAPINYDSINPATVTRESIPRTEMFPGTLIGIITADGNRGVMRVDSVTDTQLTLTFRVYANF